MVPYKNKILYFLIFALLLFTSSTYAGRGDKAGTASGVQLLIPIGARTIGMGCSPLANLRGIEAIYLNPAGFGFGEDKYQVMFSTMSWIADINVNYVAVGTMLDDIGSIGLAVKSLSIGKIQITTEDEPDGTGETTSPTFLTIGGTFARKITDNISVGFTSNIIYEKMANVSLTSICFNVGVQYVNIGGVDGLSVGALIRNIGPEVKYDGIGLLREADVTDALRKNSTVKIEADEAELPSTIEIGLGYKRNISGKNNINFTSLFQNNNFSNDEYKFGIEYDYDNLFFIRSGAIFSSIAENQENIFGPAFGLGVNTQMKNVKILVDYAYRKLRYFNGNHVFSILLKF